MLQIEGICREMQLQGKKNALSKKMLPYCVFAVQKTICVHTGLYSCTMILSENAVFWPRFVLQAIGTWNQRSKSAKKTPRLWYLAVFGTFSKWISPFDGRLDKTGKKNYRTLFQMFWMWNKSYNSLDGELLNYLFSNILPNFWLLAV